MTPIIVIRPFIITTPSEAEGAAKGVTDANIIHPKTPGLFPAAGKPIGSMKTYLPHEVLRPNPPRNNLERILRFHSVLPYSF